MKYMAMPHTGQTSGKEMPMRKPELPAASHGAHPKYLNLAGEVRKRLKQKLVPQMDMDTDAMD